MTLKIDPGKRTKNRLSDILALRRNPGDMAKVYGL